MPTKPGDVHEAAKLATVIGRRVRERRRANSWTQLEAAERLEMTGEAFARIERGSSLPTCLTLVRICRTFGVTPDAMLLDDPPPVGSKARTVADVAGGDRAKRLWAALRHLDPDALNVVEQLVQVLASPRTPRT